MLRNHCMTRLVNSVSAKYRLKYMDIGRNIGQHTRYRPNISQISAKMKISVSVLVADMLLEMYRYLQKYRLGTYIGIGWTHIGPTLIQSN
jgi:hypothetical protein